jgi:cation transport protein ChaC
VADGYIPRWVEVAAPGGEPLGQAIAFTINPAGPSFCPPMPEPDLVARIATAEGELGTAAEYLFRTRDGLRAMGITDAMLERIGDAVAAYQAERNRRSRQDDINSFIDFC